MLREDESVCVIVIENSPNDIYLCLTALFHIHILFIFIKLKRRHRIFISSLSRVCVCVCVPVMMLLFSSSLLLSAASFDFLNSKSNQCCVKWKTYSLMSMEILWNNIVNVFTMLYRFQRRRKTCKLLQQMKKKRIIIRRGRRWSATSLPQ